MRIIILAAGRGRRLLPLTKERTKCLINEFNGMSLISVLLKQLDEFSDGISDVLIVGGFGFRYLIEEIRPKDFKFKIDFINNDKYDKYDNCYSLYLALENGGEDVLIINSDCLFDKKILEKALKHSGRSFLVVDNFKRLTRESMKVALDENGKIKRLSKTLPIKKSYGEYVGISGIAKTILKTLKNSLEKAGAKNSNSFYEDAFDIMLDEVGFEIVSTDGLEWTEIDDFKDLEVARRLYKRLGQSMLKQLSNPSGFI